MGTSSGQTPGARFQTRGVGFRLAVLVAVLTGLTGCLGPPPAGRRAIDAVSVSGTSQVAASTVKGQIATRPTPRFLGVFERVFDYELFDREVLEQDVQRIERHYRAKGYYQAKVTVARVVATDDDRVRVHLRVEEGPPVRVAAIEVVIDSDDPDDEKAAMKKAVRDVLELAPGDRFDETRFEESKDAAEAALADRGRAFVKVEPKAEVDVINEKATVEFRVKPGPIARYGRIRIVGLETVPRRHIDAALLPVKGERYVKSDLRRSSEAIQALGVFASAEVRQDLRNPKSGVVPITVVLREGALRTLRLGANASLDVFKFTTGLRASWEHRNFLGDLRRFTVDVTPGLTWYPLRFNKLDEFHRALPEARVRLTLRQPTLLTGSQTGLVSVEYNVFPLIYELPDGADPAAERIIGYQEVGTRIGVENQFFDRHLYLTPSINWKANFPFTYQGDRPEGLEPVTVTFPELQSSLDFRDDALEPTRGFYLSNSLQVAVPIGGDLTDVRIRPEARVYIPLDGRRTGGVVLALKGAVGMLFPVDYGDSLEGRTGEADSPETIRDQQKLLFRVFYGGGPSSNRGYGFRSIGPHGALGFLVPTDENCGFVLQADRADNDPCLRPLGGLSSWEASIELRYPIPVSESLRGALFVDAADVRRGRLSFRIDAPHLSPGAGLRILTPVGPIRLDVAVRLPPTISNEDEDVLLEGEPTPGDFLGLPIGITAAIGEAF